MQTDINSGKKIFRYIFQTLNLVSNSFNNNKRAFRPGQHLCLDVALYSFRGQIYDVENKIKLIKRLLN